MTMWRVVFDSHYSERPCKVPNCDRQAVADWLCGTWFGMCWKHDREMLTLDNGTAVIEHDPNCGIARGKGRPACGKCVDCKIALMEETE